MSVADRKICCVKGCEKFAQKFSRCNEHFSEKAKTWKSNSKPKKPIKVKPRKASGDKAFFKELFQEWVEADKNYCIECGKWLQGHYWNMAHVVGDGECGGNRDVATYKPNIVPACLEHHTQMDNGVGVTRNEMKCWDQLEKIRCEVVTKFNLKVRSGCK